MITSLGDERDGLYASCMFMLHALLFCLFSSCWCRGSAADYDCGTSWTFHLTFFRNAMNENGADERFKCSRTKCIPSISK